MKPDWTQEFPCAITVVDANGVILEMNDQSDRTFASDGGRKLVGGSVLDCHPEPARIKLKILLDAQQPHIYSIEKEGRKKLICQFPWYREGVFSGLVELAIELPDEIPHFVR
jgi:transcriptional regulator with PAS, ATPase and Fis domain